MPATVWRGSISFGLVSIPVRLIRGARRERVRFQWVYRANGATEDESSSETEPDENPLPARSTPPLQSDLKATPSKGSEEEPADSGPPQNLFQPVHNVPSTSKEVKVPREEMLRGYQVEPDKFIALRSQDIKAIRPETSTAIDLNAFIDAAEVDPVYFDASYYVVPQPSAEKPYALLFGALRESGRGALGNMAMHGREHAVLIRAGRSGLILNTLFNENEVHLQDQHPADLKLTVPKELAMAKAFIEALSAKFEPGELVDAYEQRLKALLMKRANSAAGAIEREPAKAAPVVDIMEALRKSLALTKKPAARETERERSLRVATEANAKDKRPRVKRRQA